MKVEVPKLWLYGRDLTAEAQEFRILGVQQDENQWHKPVYVLQLQGAKDSYNHSLRRNQLIHVVKRYGDDSDAWIGKPLRLRQVQVLGKDEPEIEFV